MTVLMSPQGKTINANNPLPISMPGVTAETPFPVSTPVLKASEPFSGTADVTHTFTKTMNGFVIQNDDDTDSLTFTVGEDTFTVLAGETFREQLEPFTEVAVTTTVAFRAYGLN